MIESQKKSFLLAALALAPTAWMLSFNYGVYKTVFFSLSYIFYHVIFMLVPGVEKIYSTRLIATLFLITLFIGSIGFIVGHYHPLILSCEDFDAAGNKVPENCWPTLEIQ